MNECTLNDSPMGYVSLHERLRVKWANRWVPLTRLARWWIRRQLQDPGLYIAYEANIAMRLYDLQRKNVETFNFGFKEQRDHVAVELIKLVFDAEKPADLEM